jgi:hypothetical protein
MEHWCNGLLRSWGNGRLVNWCSVLLGNWANGLSLLPERRACCELTTTPDLLAAPHATRSAQLSGKVLDLLVAHHVPETRLWELVGDSQ